MQAVVKRPLWRKFVAGGFLAVFLASGAAGCLGIYRQYETVDRQIEQRVEIDTKFITADIEAQRRAAAALALGLAQDPDVARLLKARDRAALVARYRPILTLLKRDAALEFLTFMDDRTKVVARAHLPEQFGDDVSSRRPSIPKVLESGVPGSGIELGRLALAMFATVPVRLDGTIVGVVDIGSPLTNDYFQRLKENLQAELAVRVRKGEGFATQNTTSDGKVLLANEDLAALWDGRPVPLRLLEAGGRTYATRGTLIRDFAGKPLGIVEVASDVTETIAGRRTTILLMAALILCVSALVLLGFFIFARSLARAIASTTEQMSRLASGDLNVPVTGGDRPDEIGAMARAVQIFKDAALEKLRLADDARRNREMADEQRAASEATKQAAAREQSRVVESVGKGLKLLAQGDLTFRFTQAFPGMYRQLSEDFNAAVDRLQETMSNIVQTATGIRAGANGITRGADHLAQRTEHQASSLAETAEALNAITQTVRRTAEGANDAKNTVATTRLEAEHSTGVVRSAVDAMAQIDASSSKIATIINVINEIASQTNLLALNAGVEAARAGDSGRGFAVVASEVRALAQRSGEAAKEIRDLVDRATQLVGNGVGLVGEAGQALERIIAQIGGIHEAVVDIAASAEEQSKGIEAINGAVRNMDQVTQQNAAMVEESNTASHQLERDAEDLMQLVGQFQVGAVPSTSARAA